MKVYDYTSGTVRMEQDLVLALDDFLVNDIGWTQVERVSDTTSNRDYAWSSPGEDDWVAEGGDPVYIRLRGQSNYLYCYGYRTYTDSTTNTFELYSSTYTRVYLSDDWFDYWFYGDKNFVCGIINKTSIDEPVIFYLGLIESYYDIGRDDYPLLVKGSYTDTSSWNYTTYAYMHNCTNSGAADYDGVDWWTYLQYDRGIISPSSLVMFPVVLVNETGGQEEIRGEPRGVYQVNGDRLPIFGVVSTVSGVFITAKADNNAQRCYAYGPVASDIEGFNMWPEDRNVWEDGTQY